MRTTTHCHVCGHKLLDYTDPSIYHDQRIYPHTDQHITQDPYKVLAQEIVRDIRYIGDKSQPKPARLAVVDRLRGTLDACLDDENLVYLTRIYRNTHPLTKVNVGYNPSAVTAFAIEMLIRYPSDLEDSGEYDDSDDYDKYDDSDDYDDYDKYDDSDEYDDSDGYDDSDEYDDSNDYETVDNDPSPYEDIDALDTDTISGVADEGAFEYEDI